MASDRLDPADTVADALRKGLLARLDRVPGDAVPRPGPCALPAPRLRRNFTCFLRPFSEVGSNAEEERRAGPVPCEPGARASAPHGPAAPIPLPLGRTGRTPAGAASSVYPALSPAPAVPPAA